MRGSPLRVLALFRDLLIKNRPLKILMQLNPTLAQKISASLVRLCTRSPFFGTLAMFARVQASEHVPTAGTDGRDIFINELFFEALTSAEQDGVLLHEVLHAALLHVSRRGGRDPWLWNIAADIVVNGILFKNGYELPAGAVRDPSREELSAEEVYELILRETTQFQLAWRDLMDRRPDDCQPGDKEGALGEGRQAALEAYWRNAQAQAEVVEQSLTHGLTPGAWKREIERLSAAQLDWRSYLWRYLTHTPTDFNDFDRRFVGRGLYLDTLAGESVRVFVGVDTSGSVNDEQLRVFLSEVRGILQAYPHLRCHLYYADSALHGPYPLTANLALPPPLGGGGTDFSPFFERVSTDQDEWTPAVSVYLTDGYGKFPDVPPQYPVLWVVTPGGLDLSLFPFGEAVRLLAAD